MDEKGQFSYAVILMLIVFALLALFVFIIPLMQGLTVGFYEGLTPVFDYTNDTIDRLPDGNVKTAFEGSLTAQGDMVATNVSVMGSLVQYSGIIILIVVIIALYLVGRQNVQVGSIG